MNIKHLQQKREKIRERLKTIRVDLEQELKPMKIKSIALETDSGLKVTTIDDNVPLIRKIDNARKFDEDSIKQGIKNMLSNCKELKQHCIYAQKYEQSAILKDIENLLLELEIK